MDAAAISRAIARKRDGHSLGQLWSELIPAYLVDSLDDAQMGALLMACVLRGLDAEETRVMTEAFVDSGETLTQADARTVDKHSTGGVGDSASLIVVPWVAACGIPVAKLSGRALGHTGGTLDKLESVAGTSVELSPEEFAACVERAGCAIAAQSARLVPADRRIYALRDRTATVSEAGLIAASIVSKKIAGGAHGIAYDVKTGSGALMREPSAARALARTLVDLSAAFGRRAVALVTDMNEPLGPAIGTGLEMIEARDFLRGVRREARLARAARAIALRMLGLAGSEADAGLALDAALDTGAAAERLERMLAAQGARPGALDALAPYDRRSALAAERSGYVARIDPVALGELARDLVERHGERAGIVLEVRSGDEVVAGQTLATLYGEPEDVARAARAFELAAEPPPPRPIVYDEIEAGSALRSTAAAEDAAGADGRSTLDRK